jgi:3-dehydroquinate dehydratase/shikimate dehydrogenase
MAQVIASLYATSRDQVLRQAAKAAMAGADWLELRLDRWPAGLELAPTLAAVALPVLVACRTPEDGGHFRGTLGERRQLLNEALDAGAQGIDLDGHDGWLPTGRPRLRLRIRSFHSWTGVPKELAAIRDRLGGPGTVVKLAVTAHDLADAAPVLELLANTDQRVQPTVAFAMGRSAWPTRLLAAVAGAPFVYGCIDEAEATAPGQVPVARLCGLFRAATLSPATAVFGVIGNPALGSLGPWLHNRVFRQLGLDAIYLPFETSRPESVIAMLQRLRLRGLSITAPFKAALAAACNHLGEAAAATGVVNTITFAPHGLAEGHNTDVEGVRLALAKAGVARGDGRPAAVLGTGGAGRAGALVLQRLGFRVTMLGRSLDAVRDFATTHGLQLASLSERVLDELAPAVVVQATPVGMAGRTGESTLLPGYRWRPGTVAFDMVYQPYWTPFLQQAAAAGATVVPGVAMFLGQAAAQVRCFTGHEVAPAALRHHLAGTAAALLG